MSKIIQIAAASDSEGGPVLWALTDEGEVLIHAAKRYSKGNAYGNRAVTLSFYTDEFWQTISPVRDEPAIAQDKLQNCTREQP